MALREKTILFLDDSMIAESKAVTRVFSAATRHSNNPILSPVFPWEKFGIYIFGSVVRDPDTGLLRMWYQAIDGQDGTAPNHKTICYAESDDGIRWRRPLLPIVKYQDRHTTNIVLAHSVYPGNPYSSSLLRDDDAENPEEQYKLIAWYEQWTDQLSNFNGVASFHSRDGLHWQVYEEAAPFITEMRRFPIPPHYYSADGRQWRPRNGEELSGNEMLGGPNDASCVSPDKLDGKFVHFQVMQRVVAEGKQVYERDLVTGRERILAMHTSPDFVHWSDPVTIIEPAVDDPDYIQFYGMGGFRYGNYWLGTLWMYYVHDQSMDLELAASADGREWTRPCPGSRLVSLGESDEFDSGMILSASAPVIVGDSIHIYYGGNDHRHDENRGDGSSAAIGLATLPLDRWAGLRTGRTGSLMTKPFLFSGSGLELNAYAHGGEVYCEVLDEQGKVIPGYEISQSQPLVGDYLHWNLQWNGTSDLVELSGRKISLRFVLSNATVYSITQI